MSRESTPPQIFNSDGSINERNLSKNYGLGIEEAKQQVIFGSYKGTVAEMLNDANCPVGGMVRSAYKETGIKGVAQQFELLGKMDKNFKVEIAPSTIEKEEVKKN